MSKVITFSRVFPAHHPKKGEPTYFVEALVNNFLSLGYCIEEIDELCHSNPPLDEDMKLHKRHTIRAGERFKAGDLFSPRVWSGQPYRSGQIILSEDILIKKVWKVDIDIYGDNIYVKVPTGKKDEWYMLSAGEVAENDGLDYWNLLSWFKVHPKTEINTFSGQIICWDDSVN